MCFLTQQSPAAVSAAPAVAAAGVSAAVGVWWSCVLQVHVIASLPCYGADNVDKQRGDGVFDRSIKVCTCERV